MSLRNKVSTSGAESSPLVGLGGHEAEKDGVTNGNQEGGAQGRRPSIGAQDGESEYLVGQDNEGKPPTQYAQTNNQWKLEGQKPSGSTPPHSPTTSFNNPPFKPQRSLASRIFVDSWVWEALCWVLSVACVVAIVIILRTYDGQPIPQWSSGITLNAMVSVFTSIAKTALMFPVAESISQLKWVWFSTDRRKLQDFETFDNASKGIWGSVLLLCTPKARRWVSLGAIAMIAGAAVEPFTQQIISFPLKLAPSQEAAAKASVAYSQNFTAGNAASNVGAEVGGVVDTSMILSIYSGVFHPVNVSLDPMAPDCTTGNCTFPDFLSIGVCTKSANITHFLGQNCDPNSIPVTTLCSLMLPNGMYMDSFSLLANVSSSNYVSSKLGTLGFPDVAHPIANVFVVYVDFRNSGQTRAVEFVFEYCVKHYRTAVTNGRAHTKELATYTDYTTGHYDPRFMINSTTLVYSVPGSLATYNVTMLAQSSMRLFMRDLFQGYVRGGPHMAVAQTSFSVASSFFDAMSNVTFKEAGMERLMNNVAVSITNNIRSRNNNGNGGVGAPLQGVPYSPVPFVHAQWEWIIVLAALVLLTLVLLVGTVLQSRRARTKLWRSSSLAVLRAGAGADEVLRREWAADGMGRMGIVEMQGQGVKIMLADETGEGGGWRLVRR